MGLSQVILKGVRILLIEEPDLFSLLYPNLKTNEDRVRLIAAYSHSAIMAMHHQGMKDAIVVTNDWSAGFIPGLCKTAGMLKYIPETHFY